MLDPMTPEEVYAILCARIKNTAIGLGAVKGAPCTIASIVKSGNVNTVTFQWTATTGKVQTSTMKVLDGKDGKDGKSISSMAITAGELIVNYDDGTSQNLGKLPGGGSCDPVNCTGLKYTNLTGAAQDVGGIKKGETFNNTPIKEVLDKLLSAPYTAPSISISVNANKLYATDDVSSIPNPVVITATATKRTDPITAVKFYVGGTLVHTVSTGVASGGTFTYNYSTPVTATTVFKVVAEDGKSSPQSSYTVQIVGASYVGYVADGTAIDATVAKSLTKVVKNSKAYKYTNMVMPTTNLWHITYVYPKSFGLVSSIKDGMNFEYIGDYTKSEITIDGMDYYVYKLTTPTCITDASFFQQYS